MEVSNKITGVLLILLMGSHLAVSQQVEQKEMPAQVSFVYPVGTTGSRSIEYQFNFSLNVLVGSSGGIDGFEVGGLLNVNKTNVRGVQTAGLGNISNGEVKGMQTGGLFNIASRMRGFQVAGILNKTESAKGLQVGGLTNINTGTLSGVQIAGLFNQTKRLKGVQLGLINLVDTVESGISIGLVTIVKNGFYGEWQIAVADYMNVGLSYKIGTKYFYNIYTIGANLIEENLWIAGAGFGHTIETDSKYIFQPELVYYVYFPENFKHIRYASSSHLKLGIVRELTKKMALSLSPSIYVSVEEKENGIYGYEQSSNEPIIEHEQPNHREEIGLGLSLGFSFR